MADLDSERKLSQEPNSIKLPESMELLANLNNGKRIAIDIGCSLTKIAYYSTIKHGQSCNSQRRIIVNNLNSANRLNVESSKNDSVNSDKCWEKCGTTQNSIRNAMEEEIDNSAMMNEGTSQKCSRLNCKVEQMSRLHFVKFQTKCIENCLDFIENHILGNKDLAKGNTIKVTGGGVCKYAGCIKEKLGVLVDKEDEMCCLIKGTNFLLRNVSKEAFSFKQNGNPDCTFQSLDSDFYPYLLVTIGAGVSVFKVTDEEHFERIGGLSTGGATFWGLGSLLTSAKEYDDLVELAEKGDYTKVDTLVRDLFGNDSTDVAGFSGDAIAASFGKINFSDGETSRKKFCEADIARSLLFSVLNSVGQVASLYALMHGVSKVYFGGYFLRNNPLNMEVLSHSVNFWSENKIEALFLRHEGYLGTVGAFLKGTEQWHKESSPFVGRKYSENGESDNPGSTGSDEFVEFSICPLLRNPDTYRPDTVDLTQDEEARTYWLQCFQETVEKFAKKAVESQRNDPTALTRANNFKQKFLIRLEELKENPLAYGELTVRSILDSIDRFLHEFEFPDPYREQKEMENGHAISLFVDHIKYLDKLDSNTRQQKLIWYLLAGNMFDWGAKEVSALLETNSFGFEEALDKIPQRPWLVDSLDEWIDRLNGPPHKCSAIFVDNSGLDIILGVFPFVRELLRRGTEVILCSNSAPALNDVIHSELLVILEKMKSICPIIKESVENNRLIAMETGQTGPCLDLSRLNRSLCEEMINRKVDLIVVEGMGRSVHTNLNTFFKCESLKVAVIKNRWLARRLGGAMFCVLCQYQKCLT